MAWTKCVACGTEINDNQETCESCGSPQPKRSSGDAGRGWRFLGRLIDFVITGVIMIPISMSRFGAARLSGAGGFEAVMANMRQSLSPTRLIEAFVISQVIFLLVNGYLLMKKGQTVGKLAMGTRIVDMDGNLPGPDKVIGLRYVLVNLIGSIPFVGGLFALVDCLFIFAKDRRCLHDHIAGTRVIQA